VINGHNAAVSIDGDTHMTREHHLAQRDEKPAVGAIVVREQTAFAIELLDDGEELLQHRRIFDIRRCIPDAPIHLRQRGAAQSRLPATQIH
jgi:hypothetical protein